MNRNQNHARESSDLRYERLSELVNSYEIGSITQKQFEQRKREILLGEVAAHSHHASPIELIVTTYSNLDHLESSANNLRNLSERDRHGIIDGAMILTSSHEMVRLRSIAGLTRSPESQRLPIIVAVASLLFPVESIRVGSAESGWEEALEYLPRLGVGDADLRKVGDGLRKGAQSIAVIYWASRADEIADAFHGFDDFARRILDEDVVNALTALLQ